MSEQAPAPEQETPEVAGPAGTPGEQQAQQAQIDWEKRAHDAQAWGTQVSQEAAQYRQLIEGLHSDDPDTRREAAQALGLEFQDEDEPVDEYADPLDDIRREVEGLKGTLSERDQAAQQAAIQQRDIEYIGQGLEALQKELGRDLDEKEIQLLGDAAWQNRDEQGLPNVTAVSQAFKAVLDGHLQRYAKTKRAPHISPVGQSATEVPDLSTQDGKVAHIMSRLHDDS